MNVPLVLVVYGSGDKIGEAFKLVCFTPNAVAIIFDSGLPSHAGDVVNRQSVPR